MKRECYKCQYKARKSEIGTNKKAYRDELRGNTVSLNACETCGEKTGILPTRDMDRAIRASNNESLGSFDWD